MGKKKTLNPKPEEDLLSTLGDFTKKENWDKFFTLRGTDDSFEWYAEWPQLKPPLLSLLSSSSSSSLPSSDKLQILIPGCGNSRLSEHLYDAGFHDITNLDFSTVVISDMLRRNVRDRPLMRWRVMDITSMQLADGTFDVVLDKGGLDALMEPEFGPKLGDQYLSEVKRVLKSGGKFICLTLAESHVLGLLFPKFRSGWKMTLHSIPQKHSCKPSLNTFMVVAVKGDSSAMGEIVSSFDHSSIDCNREQAQGLFAAIEAENEVRRSHLDDSSLVSSLKDLKLAKGDLMDLIPGRRVPLTLGGGGSLFRYKAVVLDAPSQSPSFAYHCGVLLVPKTRVREWLFSSEEGQWMLVESAKAARLIMILLDSSHANLKMEELQKDLSPLVKQLEPENHDSGAQIPFMTAGDGVKHRKVVHQVTSDFTGPIVVEDVIYENVDEDLASIFPSKELVFRRLSFQRTESLVQSEALLINEASKVYGDETGKKNSITTGKSKKKEKQKTKQSQQSIIDELSKNVEVDHTFLASSYHTGIIAGFTLILPYLESMASGGGKVETVVIGLGAGLLPMFLHSCMNFLQVEAVELDPVVLRLAKEYFGFCEDECLKVHLADGIHFLKNLTIPSSQESGDTGEPNRKLDIIVVDVDSADSSSGLSCPAADFVEDAFFGIVKDTLSEQGLFIINVVSRSLSIKEMVISRMRMVFSHLYCLELEDDVNEILFAVNSNECIMEENISEAAMKLQKLLKFKNPEGSQGIADMAKKIRLQTNVPEFGNWDTEQNFSYTTYFENARKVSSSEKVNPSSSPDNPNKASKSGGRRGSEAVRAKHERRLSQEDGELQRPYNSPLRPDVGHKASVYRSAAASSDTPKRAVRANGGGFRSADHSPLHPHYQAKVGAKGNVVSSPSREKKGSSEATHGMAPSTPGRSRLRSVPRGNETPERGVSVPKFGAWDATDPSSGDGYTHIFNKVKEERHGSIENVLDTATRAQHSDGQKHSRRKKSKGCSCFPW